MQNEKINLKTAVNKQFQSNNKRFNLTPTEVLLIV